MTNAQLDVGRMRLLHEVALRGTIAGAARELGLTASAVSQQLALLEREVGTALVDRSYRGVSLTGAGHALAARAGQVLDVLAAARSDLDRLAGALGGPVSVASVASAALGFLGDAVSSLAMTHPAIEVSVVVAEPSRALALLVSGDVDLAVVDEYDYVPLAMPDGVAALPLCAEPLVLIVPPGWAGPARPALSELSAANWVMPAEGAACGSAVRSACRAAGFEPRVRWTSDDMLVLTSAVAAGRGVAVLPRMSVGWATMDAGPPRRSPRRADRQDPGEVPTLRTPHLHRRLTAVARSSVLGRPSVAAVRDALAAAAAMM